MCPLKKNKSEPTDYKGCGRSLLPDDKQRNTFTGGGDADDEEDEWTW